MPATPVKLTREGDHQTAGPDLRLDLQTRLDMANARPEWALAYRFDIVLRGRRATPFEAGDEK